MKKSDYCIQILFRKCLGRVLVLLILKPVDACSKKSRDVLAYTVLVGATSDKSGAEKIVFEFKDYIEVEL